MTKSDFPRNEQRGGSPARELELEFEPLSEQRWSKIEQGVFARLDAGELPPLRDSKPRASFSARRAGLLGLGLAAGLGVALFALGGSFRSATPSVSRISTGVTASHVALPGVVLDVSPESAVVVSGSTDESALIVIDRGEVTCEVAHRRPGAPFLVQAGEVSVEVVGTRFMVTRKGEAATVKVQEGVVRVKFRGRVATVKAGEAWPPALTAAAEAAPSVPEPPRPSEPPEDLTPAEPAVHTPRPPDPKPRQVQKAHPKVSQNSEAPASSVQTQFEQATQLEAKEPAEAIRLYAGLESSSSGWAANALFAHGRLEAARGNRTTARRILTQYLTRFPSGTNAPDARLLLSRLE